MHGQTCTIGLGFIVTDIQWNPFIAATLGEQHFGRYIVVAFIEGLFCAQTVHLGPGCLAVISQLAFIQGWPLRRVPLYSGTLYSGHPWGTTFWPLYRGVAFIEGLFCAQTVHLGPGCLAVISQLAFIQGRPLRGVPLYSFFVNSCFV